jgi:transposase
MKDAVVFQREEYYYDKNRETDTEADIAHRIGVSRQTVQNVKKDFEGVADLSAFLQRKKRKTPPIPPKATGEPEARLRPAASLLPDTAVGP